MGETLSSDLNLSGTTHTSAGIYSNDLWTFTDASGNYASANGTVSDTIVGPVDLTHSTLTVLPTRIGSGGKVTVTFTARDAFGSQELTGGLAVAFAVKGSAKGTLGKVTDNHNGTYTAAFTGNAAGSDTITATINGKPLTSKAPKITVTAQGGVRLPARAAAASGLATAQDAALLAVLAESNGGTAGAGTKKGLSAADLWSFDEE
jgi:hypothetical protein